MAAASIPDVMDLIRTDPEDETEGDAPEDNEPLVGDGGDLLAPTLDDPASDATSEGEDLFAESRAGEVLIESFQPNQDTLTIAVPDEAQDFAALDSAAGGDAVLRYAIDDGTVEIRFAGLSEVPVADIFLRVSDAASPTLDADIPLAQLIDDSAGAAALEPVDPTLPDLPPPVEDGGHVLDPVDPTLRDDPPPPGDEGTVLLPVTGDEVPAGAGDLARLLVRDGGSPLGLAAQAPAIQGTGDGNDDVTLADGGEGGLTLSQATPWLTGDAVAVDLGDGNDALQVGDGPAYGFAGAGDDSLTGGGGAVALFGGAGHDLLTGGGAQDGQTLLHGGAGDDTIIGGPGGSYLDGGEHGETPGDGDDRLSGGVGNDTIRGGWGADSLWGGAGDDRLDHRGVDAERIIAERHEFAWHLDDAPDSLDGGAGDDTLVFDRGDRATGGAGNDVFWLYAGGAGAADITDFTPGQDFLRVSLNPHGGGAGDVAIVMSGDGLDGLVQVDGATVAILRGAPDATLTDLYVETRPDVFS
ncbi:calcium-binding protein [Oceaniglobus trochenteri]|uniref:calcium-binding protein n=1 Tax=Oceaniglobus trochenteri TaxID=2763260 RepID=UPI001D001516|nr:calcium-binding protein [Oceaniglobus trochenteri]